MTRAIILAVMGWLACGATASAQVLVTYVSNDRPFFTIAVPDDWHIRTGFEVDPATMPAGVTPMPRVVSAIPEDDDVLWLGFWVPDGISDLDQAQAYLSTLKGRLLDEATVDQTEPGEVNDVPMRIIHGHGVADGEAVDFTVGLFLLAENDAVAVAAYIGAPDAREVHRDDLELILQSFTPTGR